jgi:hypothetical protein
MVLFPWCILCKSTANEHSLFNRKHFSHTLTTWCVWDTTHKWTTTSCSITYKAASLGRRTFAQWAFPLCSGAQLVGYIAVITCLRQPDTILFRVMKQRNHNLHILYCKTLWDYDPELVQLFLLFCAVLQWTEYGFLHFMLWPYAGFNQHTFGTFFFALVRKEMAPIFFCKINLTL